MSDVLAGLKSRSDFFALVFLTLGVLFFFGAVLFSGETLFGSDFILQFHPWKKFLYEHFRANGTIPFWSPYAFSGIPFIANIQASMLYPLGILYYLLPPAPAYLYSTVLHCVLGSGFMYLLMRSLSVPVLGSMLSSIVFTYNGYFMAHLYAGHLSFVQNYIWIPLIFFFQRKSFFSDQPLRWTLAAGLVLGIQILGGFPQIAFYTILAIAAHGVHQFVLLTRQSRIREGIRLPAGVILIVLTAFCIAAVQVLPTAEFTRLSTRADGLSYAFATTDSLHPRDMLSFFIPELFGSVMDGTYWGNPDGWHFWETCAYVGVLPVCLLLLARGGSTLGAFQGFFPGLALLSLLIAFGRFNPVYPLLYRLGFGYFRIPAQILFLYIFSISVIAGCRLHTLGNWERGRMVRWALAGILGAVYIGMLAGIHGRGPSFLSDLSKFFFGPASTIPNLPEVYGRTLVAIEKATVVFILVVTLLFLKSTNRIRSFLFGGLCCAILIVDLWSFGGPLVKPYTFGMSAEKKEFTSGFSRDPARGRVLASPPFFLPNDGVEHGFPSILGYDPLILRRYARFIQAAQNQSPTDETVHISEIRDFTSPLLALVHLKEVVSGDRMIRNDRSLPYLSIVENAVIMDPDRVLAFMKDPGFDAAKTVVLEQDYHGGIPVPLEPGQFKADFQVVSYGHEEINIRVSANNSCFVVMSEIFYPGWAAEVDDKPTPIFRGNYLFRAIQVGEGRHDIRLRFVSWPFRIGSAISIGSLLLALFIIFGVKPSKSIRSLSPS